ncbi:MAG: dihydroneopterin aldolase [Pseudomonadota bacterium]
MVGPERMGSLSAGEARLDGSAEGATEPADRIFLRNYVYAMEIGAYRSEYGVTQRLRFDVTLEVVRGTAHLEDRVERVINYDDIVGAITTLANGPRMQLLETLAERLAEMLLTDPRARRVHLCIAKMDRLEGGAELGVEITRRRHPEANERVWALATEIR